MIRRRYNHTVTITDNGIIDSCGSIVSDIKSLSDIGYCSTNIRGDDNLEMIFDVSSFTWYPDYLKQYDYIKSLTLESINRSPMIMKDEHIMNKLPSTERLNIFNIDIHDIPWLDSPELIKLSVHNANLLSLDCPHNYTLKRLNLIDCQLQNISTIENLRQLEILTIDDNQIIDINVLATGNYRTISLDNNRISDVNALGSCLALEELSMINNPIKHYSKLANCAKLQQLHVSVDMEDKGLEELLPRTLIHYYDM